MDILVCIKRVPDPTGEVVLTADGMSVDGRYAGYTTSPHEEAAVAMAVELASASGGSVTVLSVGSADSVEQLRSALAVGAADAILVEADPATLGPRDISAAIADVVTARREGRAPLGGSDGDPVQRAYDLVLLGNDAADTGDFQVGIRLAYALGWPVAAGIQTAAADGGVVTLKGEGPDGTEVYEVELPCVATIMEGGVAPRYPNVKGRMAAKKAPLETVTWSGDAVGSGRESLRVPPPPPSQVEVLGEGAAAAPAVVAVLKQLGVVSR